MTPEGPGSLDRNDPRYQNRSFRVVSTATASAPAPDLNITDAYELTALAEACAFAAATASLGFANGRKLEIWIKDNGTARALSWNSQYHSSTTNVLPTTTVVGKKVRMGFEYDTATSKLELLAGPTYN